MKAFEQYAKSRKVVVVGDVMLDRYWSGHSDRKATEKPIPIVFVDRIDDYLGGAGSVAINAAALGMDVHLVGCVGKDLAGRKVKTLCRQSSVQWLGVSESQTIVKTRTMLDGQLIMRADQDYDLSGQDTVLFEHSKPQIANADVLIIADYNKGTIGAANPWVKWAKDNDCLVFVDTKRSDWSEYHGVSMIKPNHHELMAVMQQSNLPKARQMIQALKQQLSIEYIWLTMAEDGMEWWGDDVIAMPSIVRHAVDATGAGDAAMAVMSALWGYPNMSQQARLKWASLASAAAVTRARNVPISWADIKILVT